MEDNRIPIDVTDDPSPERAGGLKWLPLLFLLVLVPVLVVVVVFSRQLPTTWSATDITLFILTALLCTLLAVSLTLVRGHGSLRRIERSSQTTAAQILALQETQTRLGEASHQSHLELNARISQQEGQQRLAQDGVALLTSGVQAIASNMAALSEALQAQRQATTTTLTTLTGGHGQLVAEVQKLPPLLDAMAETLQHTREAVTSIAGEQVALQDATKRLAENVTGLEAKQGALSDAWHSHDQASSAAFSASMASCGELTSGLERLRELTQTVVGAVAGATHEQTTALHSLREALTAATESIQQSQQALQTEVGALSETARQTGGTVTTVAAGQTIVHDTTKRMVEELTGLGAQQAVLSDTLRDHEQASNAALSALTGGFQQLRELTQTVAGVVTGAAQGQAAAHGSLREALAVATAALQEGQKTLQAQVEKVAEADRQTSAAVTTLTIGHGQLTNDVRQLQEVTRSAAGGISEVAREQSAARGALQDSAQLLATATETLQQGQKTLQAHVEKATETDRQIIAAVTTLTIGHGQLTNDVRQLQELTRSAAGTISEVAREQIAVHGTLQDRTELIVTVTEAVQRDQQALQAQIEKVAETARQTIAAVSAVAVEQTSGREAVRRMLGQAASAAVAALTLGQEQLAAAETRRQVLAQTVAGSGLLDAAPSEPVEKANSPLRLAAAQAIIHGEQMKYEAGPDRDNLGYWANPSDWAQWELDVPQSGRFNLVAEIAALAPGRFQVLIGDEGLAGTAPSTGDYGRFQPVELGAVELPAGKTSLAVRPIPDGWQPMNLKALDLTPVA